MGIILWEMLAGRRLFLGDTDFATVRAVRDAVVPSLRQINRNVPAELEEIVKHALARDPEKRYPSARALCKDLTRFLFRFGLPVGDDDVADLVKNAMGGPGAAPVDGTKKIAEMIDLVLLEFRSLTKDEQQQRQQSSIFPELMGYKTSPPPAEPESSDFGELGGLADELEGPDPTPQPEESGSVASWFRGLIPR
jgi:serine/threonine-protein kinase